MTKAHSNTYYQLNNIKVYPELNTICVDNNKVTIEPRVMLLLSYFLKSPNRIIDNQQIAEHVWQSNYVSNAAIQRCIGLIRKSLRDDKTNPRFIETIAKKGYRLIAEVDGPFVETIEPTMSLARKSFKWLSLALLGTFIIIFSMLGVDEAEKYSGKLTHFTSLIGAEYSPEISPDDSSVLFVHSQWKAEPRSSIYLQNLASATSTELLAGSFKYVLPKWSSNGKDIITVELSDSKQASCQIVSFALNKQSQKLADRNSLFNCQHFVITGLAWDRHQAVIYFSAFDKRLADKSRIYRFNTDTNKLQQLTNTVVEGSGDKIRDFDDKNGTLLFTRNRYYTKDAIAIFDVGTQTISELYSSDDLIYSARLKTANNSILFTSNNKLLQLVNGKTREIANSQGIRTFDIAQSSQLILASQRKIERAILKRTLIKNELMSDEREIISSTSSDYMPSILLNSSQQSSSQQDNALIFVSERTGKSQLWLKNKNGSVEALTDEPYDFFNTTLRPSPDGKSVLFFARKKLHLLDLQTKKIETLETGLENSDLPNWSSDGNSFYFTGLDHGQWQIWKMHLKSKQTKQITKSGGFLSIEAPNHEGIYFTKFLHDGLWYYSFKSNQETLILDDFPYGLSSGLQMNKTGIPYFVHEHGTTRLMQINIPSHEKIQLAVFDNQYLNNLSVSPISNSIYYVKVDDIKSDLIKLQ